MQTKKPSFYKQVKNNSVALISLFIAISSLSYNTWRNEQTEFNRNQRHAAFNILVKLNELQQVVFHHYYDKDVQNKGNLRTGWTHVLTIQDFCQILAEKLIKSCDNLKQVWDKKWQTLTTEQASVDKILTSIDSVRNNIVLLIKALD